MKYLKIAIPLLVLCLVGTVLAQTNGSYSCTDISITSASVPTSIFSPNRISTWFAHVESSPASDPVRVFFYTGNTAPTAVPSPATYIERDSGSDFYDSIQCDQNVCNDAIGQGMAAYLKSGSTATVLDFCSR